jgi:hypothetical protein
MNPKQLYLLENNLNNYISTLLKEAMDDFETLTHDPYAEKMFRLFYNKLAVPLENYQDLEGRPTRRYYDRLEHCINHFQEVMRNTIKDYSKNGLTKERVLSFLKIILESILSLDEKEQKLPRESYKMVNDGLASIRKGLFPYWVYPSKLALR